jgi:hypothetical protein
MDIPMRLLRVRTTKGFLGGQPPRHAGRRLMKSLREVRDRTIRASASRQRQMGRIVLDCAGLGSLQVWSHSRRCPTRFRAGVRARPQATASGYATSSWQQVVQEIISRQQPLKQLSCFYAVTDDPPSQSTEQLHPPHLPRPGLEKGGRSRHWQRGLIGVGENAPAYAPSRSRRSGCTPTLVRRSRILRKRVGHAGQRFGVPK